MIFKRFAANLRAQNWFAIGIELAIVIVGVFIGTQVSNWNAARIERAETVRTLGELKPQLVALNEALGGYARFNMAVRSHASVAFAGWRGEPNVDDRDFVIATYMSSRIAYTSLDNASWSQIFGSDRLDDLKDRKLKTDLSALMSNDYSTQERELFTPYRTHVRMIVPEDIQDAIRKQCPDQLGGQLSYPILAKTCAIDFPDERFAEAARDLRTRPELVGELRWHLAVGFNYVEAVTSLRGLIAAILERIDRG